MKIKKLIKPIKLTAVLCLTLAALFVGQEVKGQVRKEFSPRMTNENSANEGIYNLRGDFTMIGNTNMTRASSLTDSYNNNNNNSNATMNYVKVDPAMVNSSTAELKFYEGGDVKANCSEVIYAGLYWTGRAHNTTNSAHEFTVVSQSTNNLNNNNSFNGYSLSIISADDNSNNTTGDNRRVATYTFTPQGGGDAVIFSFYSWRTGGILSYTYYGKVTVQVGSGTPINVLGSITSTSFNNYTFTFSSPYTINSSGQTIHINSLRKRQTNNTINTNYSASVTTPAKTLNKHKVKIKGPGASSYSEITANNNDIWYPSGQDDNMYAGYADITNYVKQYGTGNYTVADIALIEGNGGSVGYFGGWSMVVVYGNAKMDWKDIVVFDGYAYLDGPSKTSYDLKVDGFHAVQGNGPVNVKIGLMAGEGDRGISNDYFRMKRQDNDNFTNLSHSGNSSTNFFNSSIVTGGNSRYPNYVNNTGIDIAMFELDNGNKQFITNEQTSTTFRYGSDQDTYIIPLIVIGIDAYIPDVEAVNEIVSIGGNQSNTTTAQPGEIVEYKIEIRNKGDEPVDDVKIEIPVPFTGSYVSAEATYHSSVTGNKTVSKEGGNPGKIVWDIGTLPLPNNKDDVLATLTYKIQVTKNCAILSNSNCVMFAVNGTTEGVGAQTGIPFKFNRFVSGFNTGECADVPLYEPFDVIIDTQAYFDDPENECEPGSGEDVLIFTFCDIEDEGISPSDLLSSFPAGTRFYTEKEHYLNPDDEDDPQEYVRGINEIGTSSNPFPTDVTTNNNHGPYYAIPPGFYVTCFWTFELQIEEFCGNFWMGTKDNNWSNEENWTIGLPGSNGLENNVVFATYDNNKGKPAVKDLHLDNDYVINDLINDSEMDLVVTTGNQLTIEGKVYDNYAPTGSIIVESKPDEPTGTLIFTNTTDNANVDATVQFYNKAYTCDDCGTLDRQKWQYFGVPVKSISSMPFPTGVNGTVNKWDETAFGNKWVAPGSSLTAFTGYEINDAANVTPTAIYNFAGKLNVGNASVGVTKTDGVNYSGRNLIGNSYTAAIPIADGFTFDNSKWNQTVYLFNTGSRNEWRKLTGSTVNGVEGGRYVSVPINNAGQGGLPSQIPSMHAFMIDATAGGNLTIDYSKLTKNASVGTNMAWRSTSTKPAAMPYIVMEVVGSQSADKVWMFENITATRSLDSGWDGVKMAESGLVQLYVSGEDDYKFQVATVPQLAGTTLGIKPDRNENMTVSFAVSSEVEGRNLFLRDLLTGRAYPIRNMAEYSVPGVSVETGQRFRVVSIADDQMGKQSLGNAPVEIFTYDRRVGVTNNSGNSCVAALYDAGGKMVAHTTVDPAATRFINPSGMLPGGVYVVKVTGDGLSETKRIMVR